MGLPCKAVRAQRPGAYNHKWVLVIKTKLKNNTAKIYMASMLNSKVTVTKTTWLRHKNVLLHDTEKIP